MWRGRPYPEVTVAFVAEFLNEGSLERLGLLDLSTCVGLRYGRLRKSRVVLFWSAWVIGVAGVNQLLFALRSKPRRLNGYNQKPLQLPQPRILSLILNRYGNINPLSIAYAIRLGLGPTNPGMTIIAQETLLFRRGRFSLPE